MKRFILFISTILLMSWLHAQTPSVSIQLIGGNSITHLVNMAFVDPGFTATDSALNDYSSDVIVTGSITTNVLGVYQLMYSIPNSIANAPAVTRMVMVTDTKPPVILPLGSIIMSNYSGIFQDPGFKLTDNYYSDASLHGLVTINHSDNITVGGFTYTLLDNGPGWVSYHLTDPSGNKADSAVRYFTKYSVGIPELQNALVSMYPNPAFDIVNLKSDLNIDRCFIMDALGNISPLSAKKSASGLQVDVSEFDNGMYTFIIECGQQRSFSKLVITNTR